MINILLSGNMKVFDGALSELISITNKTKETICCYIFTMDLTRVKEDYKAITDEQVLFLNKVVKSKNSANQVIKVDVTDLYEEEFGRCKNENAYCTPYTLLRLLADKVDGLPEKILYLDIDMMAAGDIKELYDTDVTDVEYAAVKEKYGSKLIRADYINAGMLLLNMKKIKQTQLLVKARSLIKKRKMLFADQDAIYWSTSCKKIVDRKFNEQSKFNRKETVICHFCKRLMWLPYPHTENYKQWNIEEIHKELKCFAFDDDLNEYLEWKNKFEEEVKGKEKLNREVIPIFFATDDAYVPFLAVAMKSLVDNSSEKNIYDIKVLYTSVNDENKRNILKYQTDNIKIEFVNVEKELSKIKDKLCIRDYYSDTTYFRIFIPDLYKNLNKALYLDCDIVILDDVADLYNVDLEDNYVSGVAEAVMQKIDDFGVYAEKVVGVDRKEYFNAGILLMNLEKFREVKLQEKFIEMLNTIKFPVAQDQDYLNRLCNGHVKIIDNVWNREPINGDTIDKSKLKLVHYTLGFKPWFFDDILYGEFFWEYAKRTEYYEKLIKMRKDCTDEKRAQIKKSNENLQAMAVREIAKVAEGEG